MSEPAPFEIEYAKAGRSVRPMSLTAAKWVFWLSLIAPTVGVAILVVYRLTGIDALPALGFMWLGLGGGLAFVLGVIALVNVIRAFGRSPRDPLIVRRYGLAVLTGLAAVGLAYVCAQLGTAWMETPHFHMQVTNATAVQIDKVVVHFDDGDVAVGPLSPGQATTTGLLWLRHQGMVKATVTAGGLSSTRNEREFGSYYAHGSKQNWQPFTVTIEPRELPKPAMTQKHP